MFKLFLAYSAVCLIKGEDAVNFGDFEKDRSLHVIGLRYLFTRQITFI